MSLDVSELPPRARRIPPKHLTLGVVDRNYLRVRGEYKPRSTRAVSKSELPPRARRIQIRIRGDSPIHGTTSACAENTVTKLLRQICTWNYLRVRGEYPTRATPRVPQSELPPRARRILALNINESNKIGTTSACAENTHPLLYTPHTPRNYLRVRGEYKIAYQVDSFTKELPPRARRIHWGL